MNDSEETREWECLKYNILTECVHKLASKFPETWKSPGKTHISPMLIHKIFKYIKLQGKQNAPFEHQGTFTN